MVNLVFLSQCVIVATAISIVYYVPEIRDPLLQVSPFQFWVIWGLGLFVVTAISQLGKYKREPGMDLVLVVVVTCNLWSCRAPFHARHLHRVSEL
jgi:hypothetical protein